MTSLGLAECEARRASASLFPGVEDTRRPARMSTYMISISYGIPSPSLSASLLPWKCISCSVYLTTQVKALLLVSDALASPAQCTSQRK
jgi:hypothetical protein